MKAIVLLAGAAALAVAAPAVADPHHGHGHGHGHASHHGDRQAHHGGNHHWADRDRRAHDWDRRRDHAHRWDRERHHHRAHFYRGQRYRPGYAVYYSYGRIPWRYRHDYRLSDRYRYYYSDGYIYVVDPRTMLIQQVIAALLG